MPNSSLDIYCIAIGGTGMAPLACLLRDLGHRVRGADGPLYPPMSTLLDEAGIEPLLGWDPAHLDPPPDLVVVGNAVPRTNIEAVATESLADAGQLERLSMPEALWRFLLSERQPLVVAGTHGKTTTTAMSAWVWSELGADPGYLVGGVPLDLESSFRVGGGQRFLIEGDEYNAAYFDRGAKFLHYRPQTLILTSVEYDHADLYPSPQHLLDTYRKLVQGMGPDSLLVGCGDDPQLREIAAEAPGRAVLYGLGEDNDVSPLGPLDTGPHGSRLRVMRGAGGAGGDDPEGEVVLDLQVPGPHNVQNALAVWTAARHDGFAPETVRDALAGFRGVARRLQELGTAHGITVVDDFAHHPTAVGKSLEGLRERYPGRRLVSLFEPRSLTAGRSFFTDAYRQAFTRADAVYFAPIFHAGRLEDEDRLDVDGLCADLATKGVEATACASVEVLREKVLAESQEGDVLVTMSSGGFEGLPRRLLDELG